MLKRTLRGSPGMYPTSIESTLTVVSEKPGPVAPTMSAVAVLGDPAHGGHEDAVLWVSRWLR